MIGRERPGEQSEVAQLIQQTLEQERWQREMMEQRYAQYGEDDEEVGTPGLAAASSPPGGRMEHHTPSSASAAFPGRLKEARTPFPILGESPD